MYHTPVLLEESLDGLNIRVGIYIDFTFGGGGHSAGILERMKRGRLIAFDRDPEAGQNKIKDTRLLFVKGNFRYARNYLRYYGIEYIDGALADLGVSSHQFDVPARGFSFRHDTGLDMRMNQESGKTAPDILHDYTESELTFLFRRYGEVKNAPRLAALICASRKKQRLDTTASFLAAIEDCIPAKNRQKYLARVFQALRMEVNGEMDALAALLGGLPGFMKQGARLVVITYHSLEDRMVKNYMRSGNVEGRISKDFYGNTLSLFRPVNRNIIIAGEKELERNPRSRSAKLRIGERTAAETTGPKSRTEAGKE